MRAGKCYDAANLAYQSDLWIQLDGFFCVWLLPGVGLDMLGRAGTAFLVPSVVVILPGTVLDRLGPILRMERHAVLGDDVVNWNPPVDLTLRRRIPSIPMRVEGVHQTRGEIVVAGCGPKAGHVEYRVFSKSQ